MSAAESPAALPSAHRVPVWGVVAALVLIAGSVGPWVGSGLGGGGADGPVHHLALVAAVAALALVVRGGAPFEAGLIGVVVGVAAVRDGLQALQFDRSGWPAELGWGAPVALLGGAALAAWAFTELRSSGPGRRRAAHALLVALAAGAVIAAVAVAVEGAPDIDSSFTVGTESGDGEVPGP